MMQYRLRYFYSKGAFLVLLCVTLESAAFWSFICMYSILFEGIQNTGNWYSQLAMLPVVPFLAFAPLAGWLADSKLGNFKMFKFGAVLLLLSVLLSSTCLTLIENIPSWSLVLSGAIVPIAYSLGLISITACMVTALQLGLDQMPDASPSNIISFISWFAFSMCLGVWICDSSWYLLDECLSTSDNAPVFSLLPVLSMTIVCCTIFLLAPKWLTIEPRSPQVLKTIYQVLKFAAKHKAPLNRSALIYWEEDIPSRLDLGKSRYGGPFTTEQVEDVKTFFKVVVVHLPWFIVSLVFPPSFLQLGEPQIEVLGQCKSTLLYTLTYSPSWSAMLTTLFTEFVVYPLVRLEPPSILKRIGMTCFIIVLVNVGYLVVYIIKHTYHLQLAPWTVITYSFYYGSLNLLLLITLTTQFICAQSPYNMRGLLSGCSVFLHLVSIGTGALIFSVLGMIATENKEIVQWSLAVGLSLLGFTLHCVLARWYKRRVRDEEYNVHRVVEEVYDRYLSHTH